MLLVEFKIPGLVKQTHTANFPLGVEFRGVYDDGADIIILYSQRDQTETREKPRTIEVFANIDVTDDQARNFIGFLSNGFTVWENTENTIPDQQIQ